jgi:Putative auto-transporter adhesin, head GIN domain
MKTIYITAALAFFGLASAQQTIKIEDFKNLAVSGDVVLTLVQSNESKLVIAGNEEDNEIEVSQAGGSLAIDGEGKATLYYKKSFENLAAAGDAVVTGKDEIKVKTLAIAVDSDAHVELNINVTALATAVANDAVVTLTGSAVDHNVSVDSDAVLNAEKLKTTNTTVTAVNDAIANITATGTVNATADSDAVIEIYGNPAVVNEKSTNDAVIKRAK